MACRTYPLRSNLTGDYRTPSLPEHLRRRLAGPLPGLEAQLRLSPQPRWWPAEGDPLLPAAALLLLYLRNDEWYVPLTLRRSGLRHHGGQVSLPGGRLDHPDETIEQAALREAHEEIGIAPTTVEILGRLTPLPIAVSGHLLSPVIGVTGTPQFVIAEAEVDRLIEVPVAMLAHRDSIAAEQRVRPRAPHDVITVPYFDISGTKVWGATAMVLAEFLALLE